MTLTDRQTATVLAALRSWQEEIYLNDDGAVCAHSLQLAGTGHFEDVTPLTPDEIDELCEEINCVAVPADHVTPLVDALLSIASHSIEYAEIEDFETMVRKITDKAEAAIAAART